MKGFGAVVGRKAEDFELPDQDGVMVKLSDQLKEAPVLLAFYPGDFTPVCTKQLCNYRDSITAFQEFGVRIIGISRNSVLEHAEFAKRYDFPFKLLSDPKQKVARDYGCTSVFMLGTVSRAVVIVNTRGLMLYRYVEPTILTKRSSDELLGILADLRTANLLTVHRD